MSAGLGEVLRNRFFNLFRPIQLSKPFLLFQVAIQIVLIMHLIMLNELILVIIDISSDSGAQSFHLFPIFEASVAFLNFNCSLALPSLFVGKLFGCFLLHIHYTWKTLNRRTLLLLFLDPVNDHSSLVLVLFHGLIIIILFFF